MFRNGYSEIVEEVQVSGRNLASIDASQNGEREAAAYYQSYQSASGGSANYPELALLASIQPISGQQQQQQGSSVQTPVQGTRIIIEKIIFTSRCFKIPNFIVINYWKSLFYNNIMFTCFLVQNVVNLILRMPAACDNLIIPYSSNINLCYCIFFSSEDSVLQNSIPYSVPSGVCL